MNWKRNIFLLFVLILLAGWYYFYEIRGETQRTTRAIESSRVLPGAQVDDVQKFSTQRFVYLPDAYSDINDSDRTYHIEIARSNGRWTLISPVQADCDQETVDAVVSRFTHLQRGRVVMENPDSLALYGLDKPAFQVILECTERTMTCTIGDENPRRDSFYALFNDDNAVCLISNNIKPDLLAMAHDYRNRSILKTSRNDITELLLTFPDHDTTLAFNRNDNGEWVVMSDIHDMPGDQTRIEELTGALTAQTVQSFIDDPGPMSEYGLDEPFIQIEAHFSGQEIFRFDIGDFADAGGKMRFARRHSSGPVLLVNKTFFDVFKPDLFHYRSKSVCNMDRGVINRILIEYGDRKIDVIRHGEAGWQMMEPPASVTDSTAVGTYLSNLTYLRATGLKPDNTDFGEPSATIQLFSDIHSGEALTTLTIGDTPEDGVGRWVSCSDDPSVFRVSDADIEQLLPDPSIFTASVSTD
jgi:hypothetical protein